MKHDNDNSSLRKTVETLAFVLALAFCSPHATLAATAPVLGGLSTYGVVSSTLINPTAGSIITGDVCYTTGPVSTPTISGSTVVPCDPARGGDQVAALADINGQVCTSLGAAVTLDNTAGHPTGIYTPGCYSSTGAMDITVNQSVTLNGAGVYIFRPAGALTTAANTSIILTGGATADNVFWAPIGATTLGANTAFIGNIIDAAGISLGNLATLLGRALAYGGTVTADTNTISKPSAPATLHIVKVVTNINTGTAVPNNFNLHVKLSATDVTGSPQPGVAAPGTTYSLAAGTYTISEDLYLGYSTSFAGGCDSSGNVILAPGDDKSCTVTNTDTSSAPPPSGGGGGGGYSVVRPVIHVTKAANPLALPYMPGLVTFTYTVTNPGEVTMRGIWVKDDKCADMKLISGDTNKDQDLTSTEAWVFQCTKLISTTETNIATAHGGGGGWEVYASASTTVVVGTTPPITAPVATTTTQISMPSAEITYLPFVAVALSPSFPNTGIAPKKEVFSAQFMTLLLAIVVFSTINISGHKNE